MTEKRITVLCGGDSPEREVSLDSGKAVAKGLEEAGFRVKKIDLKKITEAVACIPEPGVDMFFLALHGGWGENGIIQAIFEFYKVPYTGSDHVGCITAMNKGVSKILFERAGLLVPWGMEVEQDNRNTGALEESLQKWGALVVKPLCGGSTVAVTVVKEKDEIEKSLEAAWEQGDSAIAEAYIGGREITVAVLEDHGIPKALPAVEIFPEGGFYDYEAKYSGKSRYSVPAELDGAAAKTLAECAVKAHEALGCKVYSRADFRLDKDMKPWLLEVNTAPGMTSNSLVPKAAAAAGMAFPELLKAIVTESARARGSMRPLRRDK